MIVCHCQHISEKDILNAIGWMQAADPATTPTPAKIYRALGKQADCGGCLPLFLHTIRRLETPAAPMVPILRRAAG